MFENPISPPAKTALVVGGAAAVLGGIAWYFLKPKTAAAASTTPTTPTGTVYLWSKIPSGQLVSGQRYRFSIPDVTKLDNATTTALFSPFVPSSVVAYGVALVPGVAPAPIPNDWPKDDPNTGANSAKIEAVAGVNASLAASGVPLWQLTPVPTGK